MTEVYTEKVLKFFNYEIPKNTLITGGHFIHKKEELINSGTIDSLEIAINILKYSKSESNKLGILVNDINTDFSGEDCFSDESLPLQYKNLITANSLTAEDVLLLTEKASRNRGKKDFLKYKSSLRFSKNDKNYFVRVGSKNITLTRVAAGDKYGTPACPLIMSGLEGKKEKMGYLNSINIYYIDNENKEVIPNYTVIEQANILKKIFGININTYNFYFTKESIFTYAKQYDISR